MATQADRTAAARTRLIAAATELVAANGSASSSLLQIGARAGMSRGAVNFHFGTKVALLEAVFVQASAACEQEPCIPLDLAELLLENHRVWFEDVARARCISMLFAEGLITRSPTLRAPMVTLCQGWRDGATRSLAHLRLIGAVRADLDVRAEAGLVVAAMLGLVAQGLADPSFDRETGYAAWSRATSDRLQPTPLSSGAAPAVDATPLR